MNSQYAERSWHLLHLDHGSYALANWYRPGASDETAITSFRQELNEIAPNALGIVVAGDLNIHHARWLSHSNGNSTQGEMLYDIGMDFALKQLVREPTRERYLLDLCLSDIDGCKVRILPSIADHKALLITLAYEAPKIVEVPRKVWHFKGAQWQNLRCAIKAHPWQELKNGTANDAANYLHNNVYKLCEQYIPQTTIIVKRQSHPWLNATCEEAVRKKSASEGTAGYVEVRDACAQTLKNAHAEYVKKLKEEIASLPKGCKKWWSLNSELLQKKGRITSIPPLYVGGEWLLDATAKANAFSRTWQAKNILPSMGEDQFFPAPTQYMQDFIAIRARSTEKELKSLDINKATGPDRISARILRTLASELALPLAILCRRLLHEATWPEVWKIHYLVSLFKRGYAHNLSSYRGIHLTNILAKVLERVIDPPLVAYLQQHGFGSNQWAYRKRCGSRDLALMCITSCVVAICSGHKMSVYLSDISGAFDRVWKEYLIGKLASVGVPDVFLDFLNAYLAPRVGYVTVAGVFSDVFDLCNMVFQGTVLGPSLWNTFFADVALAAATGGGQEAMFADDLNVFKKHPVSQPNAEIRFQMEATRVEIHRWGRRNRVTFDPSKEHIVILHPAHGEGELFKLLGTLIDPKLAMHEAVDEILKVARPKVKALLRTRGFYSHADMFRQYKTHIWNYVEYHSGVIQHAAPTILKRLDDLQTSFVRDLHITEGSAFLYYNFAPACLRRDIGLLGFLHKRVLGLCHAAIAEFFPMLPASPYWHNKQLDSHMDECHSRRQLYFRSMFGMVHVYNRLPQHVVDIDSVSGFQSCLTQMAREKCEAGVPNWQHIFHKPLAYEAS